VVVQGRAGEHDFFQEKAVAAGIRYYMEAPRVKWFDRDFAGYQMSVDHAMPDTVNLLAGMSRDEKRMLWYCFSTRVPASISCSISNSTS